MMMMMMIKILSLAKTGNSIRWSLLSSLPI